MIALTTLFGGYLLSVFLGSRSRSVGGRIMMILLVIALVQVLVVVIAMFVMDPPLIAPRGH
jgi:hypothetical protein